MPRRKDRSLMRLRKRGGPPDMLANAYLDYLYWSEKVAMKGEWQCQSIETTFEVHVLPFFGETALLKDITKDRIELFLADLVSERLAKKSVWNYWVNFKAFFNWAVRLDTPLIDKNPCDRVNVRAISKRRFVKLPIDTSVYDRAAACLPRDEQTWFNFARHTGYRKDEMNRLTWDDLYLDIGKMVVPGTKTDEARVLLPIAESVIAELKIHKRMSDPACPLVFPGPRGGYVYERTWIFNKIRDRTGEHLHTRNLRDYFCRVAMKRVKNAGVGMRLMRHTNLKTTSLYINPEEIEMEDAVKDIGKSL